MAKKRFYKRKTNKSLSDNQKKETRKIVHSCLSKTIEPKTYDASSNASMTDQWTFAQIVAPSVGTSDLGQRIGDAISPVRCEFRASIIGADSTNHCRVVIYRVKSGTSSNAYFTYGSTASNSYSVVSPYSHDRRSAIEVLFDKTYCTQTGGRNTISIVRNLRMAKHSKIQFLGGTTTYEKGGLYIAYCSDSGAASHPTILYNIRTFYLDA